MRVEQNRPVRPTGSRREAKGSTASTGFAEALGTEPGQSAAPTAAPSPLGALFALQEIGDAGTERRRALARGDHLLDRLDRLRHDLLAGAIDPDSLADLARTARSARVQVNDPGLAAVLDEIELRAAVELAKLSREP
jgi:hypothetical protein